MQRGSVDAVQRWLWRRGLQPQARCLPMLEEIGRRLSLVAIVNAALSSPGVESARMMHIAADSLSEGASVTDDPTVATIAVPASTLDALRGAERLPSIVIILCEVHFLDTFHGGVPV